MKRVIAIDGPSGSGKTSISRQLAKELGFQVLDTGALYRAVALHLRKAGLTEQSSDANIRVALAGVSVFFENGRVFLDGRDVSEDIRTTEAGHYASVFSERKEVRDFLLQLQRDAALHNDVVAEGRDMTTVVFPHAWKKFYLDASEEGRARRRYLQLKEKGIAVTMEEAIKDVRDRDARDSGREIAPLKRADDAVYIDTSNMSLDEVAAAILKVIRG